MNRRIILSVVIGLAIFILGGAAGFFLQKAETPTARPLAVNGTIQLKEPTSKDNPLRFSGMVTNINGANITVSASCGQLIVPVSSTAEIYLFTKPTQTSNTNAGNGSASAIYYQPVKFSDIRIGDRLNVILNLSSDNKLEGQIFYILTSGIK